MDHVVKAEAGDPIDEQNEGATLAQREIRACSRCGTKFSAIHDDECCPVCLLRAAVTGQYESDEESRAKAESEQSNEKRELSLLVRGHLEFVHLDLKEAEIAMARKNRSVLLHPLRPLPRKRFFDARWAMALLGEARNRLSREYAAEGKNVTFEALKGFLDPLNTKKLPPYEHVADKLKVTVAGVKTADPSDAQALQRLGAGGDYPHDFSFS